MFSSRKISPFCLAHFTYSACLRQGRYCEAHNHCNNPNLIHPKKYVNLSNMFSKVQMLYFIWKPPSKFNKRILNSQRISYAQISIQYILIQYVLLDCLQTQKKIEFLVHFKAMHKQRIYFKILVFLINLRSKEDYYENYHCRDSRELQ